MPVGFAGDGAAVGRAEKLDEIHLRDMVDIAALEGFQNAASAPVVDVGLAVAGELADLGGGQDVPIGRKQGRIIRM